MARCIVFLAGLWDGSEIALEPGDFLIAADGGLVHCEALGLKPDLILGDFDSLGRTPAGAEVYPVEKDDTDAMLAAKRGVQLGYREFVFYGALDGSRLDHTVANFQTLGYLLDRGARGRLVGICQEAVLVRNGSLVFSPEHRGSISIFAFGGEARGVTIRGLHYGLEEGLLTPNFPLGVSNHFTGREAAAEVREGTLLLIWDKAAG